MTSPLPGPTLGRPPAGREPRPWHPLELPVLLAGIFMIILDFFIVNVAIPSLRNDLGASPASVQWVVAGFGLALGCGQITGGRLGDRYGRRRLFTLGMALFTVASAVCGVAGSIGLLVAGRVAQGLSAALMSPQILSTISAGRAGAARAWAVAAFGTTMGMAAACGQLIGGALTQADIAGLGWRACFLINVPVGVVTGLLAPRVIRETRPAGAAAGRGSLDVIGAVLVTAVLVGLVLPLVQGRQAGWPMWTWLCFVGAAGLLAVFVAHQRHVAASGRTPLVEPALFRERAFTVGLFADLVFFTAVASLFLTLALYLQNGLGLSALRAGLVFTQLAVGYLVTSVGGGGLVRTLGRTALAMGAIVMAAGLGLLALAVERVGTHGSLGWLTPPLLVIGLGMGLVMTPLIGTILMAVSTKHAGTAAGLLSTVQQVGNALGVAIIGVIFFGALGGSAATGGAAAYPHALTLSIIYLAAVSVVTAVLLMMLPRKGQVAPPAPARALPSQVGGAGPDADAAPARAPLAGGGRG